MGTVTSPLPSMCSVTTQTICIMRRVSCISAQHSTLICIYSVQLGTAVIYICANTILHGQQQLLPRIRTHNVRIIVYNTNLYPR